MKRAVAPHGEAPALPKRAGAASPPGLIHACARNSQRNPQSIHRISLQSNLLLRFVAEHGDRAKRVLCSHSIFRSTRTLLGKVPANRSRGESGLS